MNRPTDRRIQKIFFPDFGFRVKFLRICGSGNGSGFQIHPFFGPDFRLCMFKNYFASISDSEGNFIGGFV